jgi:hypothetical protein
MRLRLPGWRLELITRIMGKLPCPWIEMGLAFMLAKVDPVVDLPAYFLLLGTTVASTRCDFPLPRALV